MGFSQWTCWKLSKPPLHPTSFDELSLVASAHILPVELQKTPTAKMRIIERGVWPGTPLQRFILISSTQWMQEEAKVLDRHHKERDTTLCQQSLLKIRSVLQNNSGLPKDNPVTVLRGRQVVAFGAHSVE